MPKYFTDATKRIKRIRNVCLEADTLQATACLAPGQKAPPTKHLTNNFALQGAACDEADDDFRPGLTWLVDASHAGVRSWSNINHWSETVFPFFNAIYALRNAGVELPPLAQVAMYQVPSEDELMAPRGLKTEWYHDTLAAAVLYQNNATAVGGKVLRGAAAPMYAPDFAGKSVCFADVVTVVVDTIAPRFYTAAAARAHRSNVFRYLGMPQAAWDATRTRWASLLFRTTDRVILNEEELADGLRDELKPLGLQLRTYVLGAALPFKEQMELYGSTRLLISYHGAQLTNVAFMMDDAAVIEIFNCRHFADTYERTALESGLVYFAARPTKAGCEVPSPKRHAVGNLNRSVPIDEITPILGKVKRKLRL